MNERHIFDFCIQNGFLSWTIDKENKFIFFDKNGLPRACGEIQRVPSFFGVEERIVVFNYSNKLEEKSNEK